MYLFPLSSCHPSCSPFIACRFHLFIVYVLYYLFFIVVVLLLSLKLLHASFFDMKLFPHLLFVVCCWLIQLFQQLYGLFSDEVQTVQSRLEKIEQAKAAAAGTVEGAEGRADGKTDGKMDGKQA